MDAPGPSPIDHLGDRLHSAALHLLRQIRQEDAAMGLTAPRLSVLSVLVFGGPKSLGELAAAEQVRPPTMTRLVQALEADGYVARAADPSDGRVVTLRATPKASGLLRGGRKRRVTAMARALEGLTTSDRQALTCALPAMERLVERLRGGG